MIILFKVFLQRQDFAISLIFAEILMTHDFEVLLVSPSWPDHTKKKRLTSNHMQKIKPIPQFIFQILKFRQSYDLQSK